MKPCPVYIVIDRRTEKRVEEEGPNTYRVYCEAGEAGHQGSHVGSRPQGEYNRLLRAHKKNPTAGLS